jgi:hypothetical protein
MTSPEDFTKDDPIIHEVLTSQEEIGKRYGLAKGDTIDGEMIDRLAIPEDSNYSTLLKGMLIHFLLLEICLKQNKLRKHLKRINKQ